MLNGDFTIQWSGDYEVAGTTLHYERRDDLYDRNETEYFQAAGPLKEPLQLWVRGTDKNNLYMLDLYISTN